MAIPSRIIEGIYTKELKAEDYYTIYGEDTINKALEELQNSNIQILNTYKVDDIRSAVQAKLSKTVHKPVRYNSVKSFRVFSYAAAAVVLAAVILPISIKTKNNMNPQTTERLKGASILSESEPTLYLYRNKNGVIQSLDDGSFAHQGDVIQITYTAGQNDYGVIFSIDGSGNITRHFPNNSWKAEPLKHGNDEIPLDFSYELDNAPDFEFFVMVSSKKEFDLNNLSEKIKDTRNLDYLKTFDYLPQKTDVISFVLDK